MRDSGETATTRSNTICVQSTGATVVGVEKGEKTEIASVNTPLGVQEKGGAIS